MTPARWAAAGALAGALTALLAYAPAAWPAAALAAATQGRVQLAQPAGTLWRGSAVLVLAGPGGSHDATVLPGRLAWTLRWRAGALELALAQPCCIAPGLRLRLSPGWSRQTLALLPGAGGRIGQWPAAALAGLGTPWNTLQLGGTLRLSAAAAADAAADPPAWTLTRTGGRIAVAGGLQLELLGLSSRLATVAPLGSYSLTLSAPAGAATPALTLVTLEGALRLSGSGSLGEGRLRFAGQAEAAPGSEAALNNLLNIIGRRQGAASMISIG
jgi:general secretion pathway protein N